METTTITMAASNLIKALQAIAHATRPHLRPVVIMTPFSNGAVELTADRISFSILTGAIMAKGPSIKLPLKQLLHLMRMFVSSEPDGDVTIFRNSEHKPGGVSVQTSDFVWTLDYLKEYRDL